MRRTHPIPRHSGPAALLLATALLLPACGDDDESDAFDSGAFCALATELNEMEGFPSVGQIEEYAAAAPEELDAPLDLVLDLLRGADGDFTAVFADEAGGEAIGEITATEAELCGLEQGGGGEVGAPQDPAVTALDPAATRVDVEAVDYGFNGAMPSTPGRYSFVMSNAGEEPHLMILIRLAAGATLEEAFASEGEEGVAEEFESEVATPGGEGVLTADLGPGDWVLLCPIPDSNGTPHFASGMVEEFAIS